MTEHEREHDTATPAHVEAPANMGTLSGFGANEISAEIDRQPTDRRICEEICTILVDNPQLPLQHIEVEVAGGVATLRGTARDAHTRQRAEDLAAMVVGVKSVRNELEVAS
jgi:osmotically-inducible protein OsmY